MRKNRQNVVPACLTMTVLISLSTLFAIRLLVFVSILVKKMKIAWTPIFQYAICATIPDLVRLVLILV